VVIPVHRQAILRRMAHDPCCGAMILPRTVSAGGVLARNRFGKGANLFWPRSLELLDQFVTGELPRHGLNVGNKMHWP